MPDTPYSSEVPAGLLAADEDPRGPTRPTTQELFREMRARAACGDDLDEVVREVLEPADVDEDVRSALWLLAWLRCDGAAQLAPKLAHLTRLPGG